jgi:hypothetical protein
MLARFERLMQHAVEGSLRRVLPTNAQPVQLAKAAARAMEEAQVIGVHGPQVPNSYRLLLAPADLERFADYRQSLSNELAQYLVDYASERGLRPIAAPRVELLENARLRPGSVRAEASFARRSRPPYRARDAYAWPIWRALDRGRPSQTPVRSGWSTGSGCGLRSSHRPAWCVSAGRPITMSP